MGYSAYSTSGKDILLDTKTKTEKVFSFVRLHKNNHYQFTGVVR